MTVNPVDDPAIITGDFNATINEDGVATGDLNASDIEGLTDGNYFTVLTPHHSRRRQPSIPLPAPGPILPARTTSGPDAFQVLVTDDLQGITPAVLHMTINPVDDPAIITGDFNATINEDGVATGDLNASDMKG